MNIAGMGQSLWHHLGQLFQTCIVIPERFSSLPEHLTANGLLEALNLLLTREEFEKL